MTSQDLHQGAIGADILINFTNDDGDPLSLLGATTVEVYFEKHNGEIVKRDLTVLDEDSGYTRYRTVAGDIDVVGKWRVQGRAVIPGASGYDLVTYEGELNVLRRLASVLADQAEAA